MTPWHDMSAGDVAFLGLVVLVVAYCVLNVVALGVATLHVLEKRRHNAWTEPSDHTSHGTGVGAATEGKMPDSEWEP